MKKKNLIPLNLYEKYGEGYDRAIPYNSRLFKLTRYGMREETRPLERPSTREINKKIKLYAEADQAVPPTVAVFGASIIQGLR